jgi:multiple sugar transport system substrate-binding protein
MSHANSGTQFSRRSLLKGLFLGSSLLATGPLLAACGTSGAAPTTAAPAPSSAASAASSAAPGGALKGQTINALLPLSSPLDDQMYLDEGKRFEAATGIKFNYQTGGSDLFDRIATLVAGKSQDFDVYYTHYAQIGRYQGGFQPLNDYAARDGIKATDFIKGSFEALTVKQQLLAVPMRFDLRGFYWRTDLFEKAGLKDPPKTREELLQMAQKTNNPPAVYGYVTVGKGDPALREFSDLLWENGGDFLEKGLEPSKPIFNQDAGVEALQWWYDLIWKHKVTFPGTSGYQWTDLTGLFAGGQGVMSKQWTAGAFEDPAQSQIVGKYGITGIPAGPKSSRTTAVCHARAVNNFSTKKDAAWEFIKFESSEENWLKRSALLGERPSRVSALQKVAATATGTRKADLDAAMSRMDQGYTWPLFTEFNQIQPIIWGEIEAVLSNQKKPKEALDHAADEATKILQKANLL